MAELPGQPPPRPLLYAPGGESREKKGKNFHSIQQDDKEVLTQFATLSASKTPLNPNRVCVVFVPFLFPHAPIVR